MWLGRPKAFKHTVHKNGTREVYEEKSGEREEDESKGMEMKRKGVPSNTLFISRSNPASLIAPSFQHSTTSTTQHLQSRRQCRPIPLATMKQESWFFIAPKLICEVHSHNAKFMCICFRTADWKMRHNCHTTVEVMMAMDTFKASVDEMTDLGIIHSLLYLSVALANL